MPYLIHKLRGVALFKVYNPVTKEVKAKASPIEKAKKQVRLLNAIEHGFKPVFIKKV